MWQLNLNATRNVLNSIGCWTHKCTSMILSLLHELHSIRRLRSKLRILLITKAVTEPARVKITINSKQE